MGYFVETRWSGSEENPTPERMREILAELDVPDDEHPDTWLGDEDGWTLSAYQSGALVLENLETGEGPFHRTAVPRDDILRLWLELANGRIDDVRTGPWNPGVPSGG